jgi:hypothetical protein
MRSATEPQVTTVNRHRNTMATQPLIPSSHCPPTYVDASRSNASGRSVDMNKNFLTGQCTTRTGPPDPAYRYNAPFLSGNYYKKIRMAQAYNHLQRQILL